MGILPFVHVLSDDWFAVSGLRFSPGDAPTSSWTSGRRLSIQSVIDLQFAVGWVDGRAVCQREPQRTAAADHQALVVVVRVSGAGNLWSLAQLPLVKKGNHEWTRINTNGKLKPAQADITTCVRQKTGGQNHVVTESCKKLIMLS